MLHGLLSEYGGLASLGVLIAIEAGVKVGTFDILVSWNCL